MVAIDGAFFDGSASKASVAGRASVWTSSWPRWNARSRRWSARSRTTPPRWTPMMRRKRGSLKPRRNRMRTWPASLPPCWPNAGRWWPMWRRWRRAGRTVLSRTDPDYARLLSKNGQSVAGYNVQIAVDDAHKLIVASEVVNDGNDTGQPHAMAQAACVAVVRTRCRRWAEFGLFQRRDPEGLRGQRDRGLRAPNCAAAKPLEEAGRFAIDAFVYDAGSALIAARPGKLLHAMGGGKLDQSGKLRIRSASRRSVCSGCPKRTEMPLPKATRRVIERWEHEEATERHRRRMATGELIMRRRKAAGGRSVRHTGNVAQGIAT